MVSAVLCIRLVKVVTISHEALTCKNLKLGKHFEKNKINTNKNTETNKQTNILTNELIFGCVSFYRLLEVFKKFIRYFNDLLHIAKQNFQLQAFGLKVKGYKGQMSKKEKHFT